MRVSLPTRRTERAARSRTCVSARRRHLAASVVAVAAAGLVVVPQAPRATAATKAFPTPKLAVDIENGGPYRATVGRDLTLRLNAAVKGQLRTNRDLTAIGAALLAYRDANGSYPPAALSSATGQPLLSWRVLLLPYLGHADLYAKFDLTKPWDDPANKRLLASMPDVYRGTQSRAATTSAYVGVGGSKGVFRDARPALGDGVKVAGVIDGITMTAAVGPAGAGTRQQWSAPGDLNALAAPTLGVAGGFDGPGTGFTPLLFLDGVVHTFPDSTSAELVGEWFSLASAAGCTPPDNLSLHFAAAWDLDGDGTYETTGFATTVPTVIAGSRSVRYLVADSFGGQRSGNVRITAK